MELRRPSLAEKLSPTYSHDATSPVDLGSPSSVTSVKREQIATSPTGDLTAPTSSPGTPKFELYQRVVLFPDLSRLEMCLLDAAFHKQMNVDKYLIGPSFREQHLQAFADHLDAGMIHLKDAFIACASVLVGDQQLQQLALGQQIGFRRAAAAVASLRSSAVTVHRDHDLSVILILGVAMVTFAFHNDVGAPEPMCSYILGLVKSYCRDSHSLKRCLGDNGLAFLVCLLGTETESCLIKCEVPTLQIRVYEIDQCVDRFIGVSLPMLAYYYDVCELAKKARSSRTRSNGELKPSIWRALKRLECHIEKWQPAVPTDFLTGRFAPAEVTLMLTQSKILRLTGLLILHRLKHAYGSQDGKAIAISSTILSELETVLRLTGRSVPFAEMPHLAASFEVNSLADRRDQLAKSDAIVDFSPFVCVEHKAWLASFWAVRDRMGDAKCIYWDDVQTYIACAA
ncbi:Zn(II)2Cys6 transcription factor [Pochonia chlamydosporia 170]|uniref:Zn(II)2Cys6 transcription factor n=1 Tax=Pochonia chlamydosporia 170 TaxID=1380566 RepID=A0A179FBG9_METCM|nr:Zn(II)2Cys6 transcription factor [Pochonia chlamydosporia 170]OAQ62802.1 Zn(II)2Cys6 transcription factor [Pochonia chlamydosporia 170]